MAALPTQEEIARSILKLNPNKSPGPDGLTSGFYRGAWGTVGDDVTQAVLKFFQTAFMPTSINATILTMVPKRPGASLISDYRPISCCNSIYKTVSKLLVSTLKPLLPDFINPTQTAFVKGRVLVENSLLAADLVNGYQPAKGKNKMTLKIDIAKAFDTVRWDFILRCLFAVEVPNQFIRWIEACITTPSFSVAYNGRLHGYFKGKRGVRQGDLISPYLFVIAMNCLSSILDRAAEDGLFGYHHRCREKKLTHLCFADDLLIFSDGSLQSIQNIISILKDFEAMSGLAISLPKTSFFSSGLTDVEIKEVADRTGITPGNLPIRYLGLPLCTKKLTISDCSPLIQRVKEKLNSWTAKSLSFAGRLQLINSVISGITNFWCSSFVLPKKVIKTIETLSAAYIIGI